MIKILKRISFSFFVLYSFNLIAVKFNYVLPINFYTVGIVSVLGIPGMILLCICLTIIV